MKNHILIFSLTFFVSAAWGQKHSDQFIKSTKQYEDVVRVLERLQQEHPEDVELFELGTSNLEEIIYGLRIGHGEIHNLVVGTHHGNEYGSTEVAQAFAESLAAQPLEGQTLHVIPVLNINGYNKRRRRENAMGRSHDPNRDYPGPCGTQGPWNLKSTRALADYIAHYPIVNAVTLHTYSPAVLYPWGISTEDTETEYTETFVEMGKQATLWSDYDVGNSTDMLYPADGTFEDYAFWKHGIWSLLFELGRTHYPSGSMVEDMIKENVPGLRNMFEKAPVERAPHHAFRGDCNTKGIFLDLGDE